MDSMTPAQLTKVAEEVRANGYDPRITHSCAPAPGLSQLGGVKGVHGCDVWDQCPFNLTRNGGFKGYTWRPKNVAAYVKPDPGRTNQNVIMLPCYKYARLMGDRIKDGIRDRDLRGGGEIIQIVAQEGEEYSQIVWKKKDPLNPLSPFSEVTVPSTVPEYKHPDTMAGSDGERAMLDAMKQAGNQYAEPTGPPNMQRKPEVLDWPDESKAEV